MFDPIARLNSALEGRYRIERQLGEGGMATVYLADDLKHERKVALKVLKPELAAVVGAERFLAEIKTTANLQHPHILPLFDSGEADSFLFYVMPYVEGESLRERLNREHQLPVDEAVALAKKVAGALQAAHERGVIHRDIKPANILLSKGEPLVSDFGIALAVGAAGGGRLTETGLSLGTPHYMSPEQATGDVYVGPATDIYALGCVLYEILVGEPPYTGSTPQAILGKIITELPAQVTKQRKSVPANVEAVIARALEKVPADRFRGASALARSLEDPGFRHGSEITLGSPGGRGQWTPLAIASTALALLFGAVTGWFLLRTEATAPLARFTVSPGEGQDFLLGSGGVDVAISPDGTRMVLRGMTAGASILLQRSIADLEPVPVPGTENHNQPAFSPDGVSLAFGTSPGIIKTVALAGGPVTTVVPGGATLGGIDWGPDDMIYYSALGGGIHRVSAAGGTTETVTTDPAHRWPDVLPDGRGVLVTILSGDVEERQIAVVGPDGGEARVLFRGHMARYATSGHIAYTTADGTLMAVPFDLRRLEVTGAPLAIVEGVQVGGNSASQFALSETGTLLYTTAGTIGQSELVWVTRSGEATPADAGETIRWPVFGQNNGLRLSPDGDRVAFTNESGGDVDIWTKALPDGPMSRLTFDDALDQLPVWTPDGRGVTFASQREAEPELEALPGSLYRLWTTRANGTGEPELVYGTVDVPIGEGVWSPDATTLVLRKNISGGAATFDLLALRTDEEDATPLVANEQFSELHAAVSRDGRWVAYTSDEAGVNQVFVRPFPDASNGRWQVSTEGGYQPVWAHNGRELFFVSANGDIRVAEFEATTDSFERGRVSTLFSALGYVLRFNDRSYDIAPDDRRFMMVRDVGTGSQPATRVILVQSFFEEVKRLVPN
jgi:serine/threonine-protein kinase